MVNMTQVIYFRVEKQGSDFVEMKKYIKEYTPLKTKQFLKEENDEVFIGLEIYWDEDVGSHSSPSPFIIWDSSSIINPIFDDSFLSFLENLFEFERKEEEKKDFDVDFAPMTPPDFGFENLFDENIEDDFETAERKALEKAKEYLLGCGNFTENGYKECIRDAFTPFCNRFKPDNPEKAIEVYYDKITIIYGNDTLPVSISNGIKAGLKSVFADA